MYHYHFKTISWFTNRRSPSNRIIPLMAALTRRTQNTMMQSALPQGPDPHLSDDHRRTDDWTTKLKKIVCAIKYQSGATESRHDVAWINGCNGTHSYSLLQNGNGSSTNTCLTPHPLTRWVGTCVNIEFLTRLLVTITVNKPMFNELDTTFHVFTC